MKSALPLVLVALSLLGLQTVRAALPFAVWDQKGGTFDTHADLDPVRAERLSARISAAGFPSRLVSGRSAELGLPADFTRMVFVPGDGFAELEFMAGRRTVIELGW